MSERATDARGSPEYDAPEAHELVRRQVERQFVVPTVAAVHAQLHRLPAVQQVVEPVAGKGNKNISIY